MTVLSKSKLLAYRQCPKRLWLEIHRPELREDSAGTQARFQVGHTVGEIARRLYDPKGTGTLMNIKSEGFAAALKRGGALLCLRRHFPWLPWRHWSRQSNSLRQLASGQLACFTGRKRLRDVIVRDAQAQQGARAAALRFIGDYCRLPGDRTSIPFDIPVVSSW